MSTLIERGASFLLDDDLGGPLRAALKFKKFHMIAKYINSDFVSFKTFSNPLEYLNSLIEIFSKIDRHDLNIENVAKCLCKVALIMKKEGISESLFSRILNSLALDQAKEFLRACLSEPDLAQEKDEKGNTGNRAILKYMERNQLSNHLIWKQLFKAYLHKFPEEDLVAD